MRIRLRRLVVPLLAASLTACAPEGPTPAPQLQDYPLASILLITLDTTRADRLGFESGAATTPNLDALAARGVTFSQAYSTVPTTLPAHASMMTGLYPAEHGIHENARVIPEAQVLLAERLSELGYRTAAFVSGFPLSGQFGLAQGFDHYDDDFESGAAERRAGATTDRALAYLRTAADAESPLFLWVHYFDPHDPYDPPEPFRTQFASDPYQGEIAYMDHEIGRLLDAFENSARPRSTQVLVAGDHGEGLGEHGEALHGNLLYQGVMRVPLIVAGTDIPTSVRQDPVSIRQISSTIRRWARDPNLAVDAPLSLLPDETKTSPQATAPVLAEAMKPHLQYGWQPQVMAVRDGLKIIRSGDVEVYDLTADPTESQNLAGAVEINPELRQALRAYALPSTDPDDGAADLSQEDRERLASLGYVDWQGRAPVREDAPSPKQMTHLFADLDLGSGLFIQGRYQESIPVFDRVLSEDPHNLMVCLRLAVAHSVTGQDQRALEHFERARLIDPGSTDLRHYLAMHHFRVGRWEDAASLFESVLAQMPNRRPALEALARIRERQGRIGDALALIERAATPGASAESLLLLGDLRMAAADTAGAIAAFERARDASAARFPRFLELGVLYLAERRFEEARDCLDQIASNHPGYPMALFKRAQVSVLLDEPDREQRIQLAKDRADATTRRLIESEALFRR